MNTTIVLTERGTSFATRTRAAEIVKEIQDSIELEQTEELTVDLTGVRVVSPSFAAAFISHLRSLLSRPAFHTEIINIKCDSPFVLERFKQAFNQNIAYIKNSHSLDRVLIG